MKTGVAVAKLIRSDLKRMGLDAKCQGERVHGREIVTIMPKKYGSFTLLDRDNLWRLGELYGFGVNRDRRVKRYVLFEIR